MNHIRTLTTWPGRTIADARAAGAALLLDIATHTDTLYMAATLARVVTRIERGAWRVALKAFAVFGANGRLANVSVRVAQLATRTLHATDEMSRALRVMAQETV